MQGFSFVDDINHRRRQENKLDERLRNEEAARKHQRSRMDKFDADREEDRVRADSEFDRTTRERELIRAADAEALKPEGERDEDILRAGAFGSALTQQLFQKENRLDELQAAMIASRGTDIARPAGLNEAANTQAAQPFELDETGRPVESLVAPSRGQDSIQDVDIDDIYDPDEPKGFTGFPGRVKETFEGAGNRASGAFLGLAQAAGNLGLAAGDAITGNNTPNLRAATGIDFAAEVGNEIAFGQEYTSKEEFEALTDPAEIEARGRKNTEMREQLKARGIELGMDRLDALRHGSREQRAAAAEAEFHVQNFYDNIADPNEASPWRSLALDDPQAAAIKYFNDRKTLQAANPGMADQVDMFVQPVIRTAHTELTESLGDAVVGTPEYIRGVRDLRALQASQADILRDTSPSAQSGINDQGLPIGNAKLSQQVLNYVDDPNRPRPVAPLPGRQVATAATMTNRMTGTRRATDAQLKAGILMVDAKLASSQDLMVLNMTGAWPPTAPAAKLEAFKPGEHVYSQNSDGSYKLAFVVPGGKTTSRGGRSGGSGSSSNDLNQVTPAILDQFRAGIETMFPAGTDGNDEFIRTMEGLVIDDADLLQEVFDLRDPIAGRILGRSYAAAFSISEAENSWLPNFMEEAPTMREILSSPDLASRLAVEHGLPMPRVFVPRMDGVKVNNMREEILTPNKYNPILQQTAEELEDAEFVRTIARYDDLVNGE